MSCFPCFSSGKSRKTNSKRAAVSGELNAPPQPENSKQKASAETKNKKDEANNIENGNIAAQTFTFRELATATKNFRLECLLGEGGFGRVYKGTLEKSGQVVAVKQLDRTGLQGNKEFLVEVLMLSLLHHQNLVNLIGYCADGDQRLLVYEYLSGGSVEDHLLDIGSDQKPLDWFTRMKIASGAAKGLEYLHDKANPPVIYRDLKASNILLDEDFNPKLSDFGLAKLGTVGDKMNVSSRVMGTYGYCAPEYARAGELTMKSDVYSFGVVLLELITGRRVIDTTRPNEEQNLVSWAQPIFRNPKRFPDMADPLLNGQFPERGLNQAVAIAAMCLQEEASVRPLISDVVSALSFLSVVSKEDIPAPLPVPTPPLEEKNSNEGEGNHNHQKSDDEGHHSHSENEDEDDQDHEDGGSSDHEDGDSAKHRDGDNSDYEDEDLTKHQYENSSHRQEGESAYQEDKESEDEHQQTVKEAKVWALNSSHKSSKGSRDGINYFSHTSSIGSDDESVFSSSPKSKRGSQDGIVSLSRNSSRESEDESASLSRYSSGKSDYGNVFSSRNSSSRSQDGGVSLSHNSSRGSQDGSGSVFSSTHNSSRGSQHGSVSLIKRPEKQ